MRNEHAVPAPWELTHPPKFAGDSSLWFRKEPSRVVAGYFLTDALPRWGDGTPSKRLPAWWRDFEGVTWWWRVDGPEEEWQPAGHAALRAAEHAGGHIARMELFNRFGDDRVGPCPECARLRVRSSQERGGL